MGFAAADPHERARRIEAWVQRWLRRRELDPAWNVSACMPLNNAPCIELARLQRQGTHVAQVRLNQLRGACAEQRTIQRLCKKGYGVQNQLPIGRLPGQRGVLDVQPLPGSMRQLSTGLEVKYVHAIDTQGRLRPLAAFERAVRGHAAQVRRHMAQLPAHRSLPQRIQLLYQIGGAITPAQFRGIANTIQATLAATPGVRLQAQVVPAYRS
jgi:hypothetical protein